jgi:transposase, IS5 family
MLDHSVEQGNPPDAPQLRRRSRGSRSAPDERRPPSSPTAATARPRSIGSGVKNVVGPRKGKPSKARHADEHRKAFRRTIKWRTASEGRISYLKRNYGWDRTRIAGTEGARI